MSQMRQAHLLRQTASFRCAFGHLVPTSMYVRLWKMVGKELPIRTILAIEGGNQWRETECNMLVETWNTFSYVFYTTISSKLFRKWTGNSSSAFWDIGIFCYEHCATEIWHSSPPKHKEWQVSRRKKRKNSKRERNKFSWYTTKAKALPFWPQKCTRFSLLLLLS